VAVAVKTGALATIVSPSIVAASSLPPSPFSDSSESLYRQLEDFWSAS
jgi:hypothetical protein